MKKFNLNNTNLVTIVAPNARYYEYGSVTLRVKDGYENIGGSLRETLRDGQDWNVSSFVLNPGIWSKSLDTEIQLRELNHETDAPVAIKLGWSWFGLRCDGALIRGKRYNGGTRLTIA